MRRIVVVLGVLVVLGGSVLGAFAAPGRSAAGRKIEFTSREAVLAWIGDYRRNADPARVPAAIKAASEHGALKDPDNAGVYVGFLAGVIASDPAKAEELVAKILPLPPEQQWVIVKAIAYSGLGDWKELMRRVAGRVPTRKVMIEKYLAGKLLTVDEMTFKEITTYERFKSNISLAKYFKKADEKPREPTPELLDVLWGYYFATGANSRMSRIIAMLPWSKDRDSVEKLTVGHMAKYTLTINAARDGTLLALLKRVAPDQPKNVAPILNEVIDAVETAEMSRIRQDALAAIEELKRKGPGTKRDISLAGQVGEGALAIGCIAAAVTGQVQFGIPCVVGGVATSAALRLWDTPN